jgi:glyoxylase-like metal-dependent hydrolase (beta-lactamase superfamily II)
MKNFKRLLMCLALSLSMLTIAKQPVDTKSKLSWQTIKVANGLYMLIGEGGFTGGNIGLSVGEDGVILIDDAMPSTLDILQDAIKDITTQPIDFLINTHVHGDHTGNNEVYGHAGAHIVAHENLRKYLLEKGVRTADGTKPVAKNALPVITFADSIDFHLNGKDAHVFHVPHAHTDGDVIIHFTHANVIHMGDTLFNRRFPFIDLASGGSLEGYIAAQKTVLKLLDDKTKIIPGHGPLGNKQDLENSIAMLEFARDSIGALIKAGKTEAEIVAINPLKEKYSSWAWDFINLEKMTQQIYQSIVQAKNN